MNSEMRDELVTYVTDAGCGFAAPHVVDAILAKYDVVPKPAIEDAELGSLMHRLGLAVSHRVTGARLREELALRGLVIVEGRS